MSSPCEHIEDIAVLKQENKNFRTLFEHIDKKQDKTLSLVKWSIGVMFGAILLLAMNYGTYIADYKHMRAVVTKNSLKLEKQLEKSTVLSTKIDFMEKIVVGSKIKEGEKE